jgi:hypothetical protein
MPTLIIGNVAIKADTLKELTKLAKQEEKRQAQAKQDRERKEEEARRDAWASYGLLSYRMDADVDLWFRDVSNGHRLTSDGTQGKIHFRTDNGSGAYCYQESYITPTHVIEELNGNSQAVRLHLGQEAWWYTVGCADGVVTLVTCHQNMNMRLESLREAYFLKHAA